ncbi:MAG: phosphate regulon transcriptional regulator PhoB [Pseudomonadota bacterium]|nr:phosphate regulon transcriptional regulatory protein PhoB [Pseudomonadales bacterium]MDY6920235.1 phosphate regulon transcriptional regulator PhoB [Pseudomonadota bacterium]
MADTKILIVDDEEAIREMISVSLELAGFQWIEAENGQEAHSRIVDERPDLVLLDWMLPGVSGIELARRLKREETTAEIPVIMLTAKTEEDNKIQGLDAGADDYVTKPFSTRELISRINAVLRRTRGDQNKAILVEGLALDPVSHRITADDNPVEMGPTEYRLLEFFMTHQDRAYSRAQLLDQVWGGNVYVEDRTVDVHIRRLRKALAPHKYDHLVQTVRGTGYRFSTKF